jgi:hypothetical protein
MPRVRGERVRGERVRGERERRRERVRGEEGEKRQRGGRGETNCNNWKAQIEIVTREDDGLEWHSPREPTVRR